MLELGAWNRQILGARWPANVAEPVRERDSEKEKLDLQEQGGK